MEHLEKLQEEHDALYEKFKARPRRSAARRMRQPTAAGR